MLLRLDVAPSFWFDEGYRANAARTLVERGLFATYTVRGFVPFDPGVSVGPVDILGTAAGFKLFGFGVVQARLSAVLFTLLGLFCLNRLLRDLTSWQASLFICLLVLAAPPVQGVSFILLGRQMLGETTAFALVVLSFWLWLKGWRTMNWRTLMWAGIVCGLGVLSRQQWGLALGPAMLLVAVARSIVRRQQVHLNFVPLIALGLTVIAWKIIEFAGTPSDIRAENGAMALEAVRANLLTGLWGRTLTPNALGMVGLMLLGAGLTFWQHRRVFSRPHELADAGWMELMLGLFVLFTAIWFALFSVGWPRYGYAGLIGAQVLIGKGVWAGLNRLAQWHATSHEARRRHVLIGVSVAAMLALLFGYSLPKTLANASAAPQQTADYIRQHIPRTAVIETWEWELDALSGHWQYHHPHQTYLFKAIQQVWHQQGSGSFDLAYDALASDPDYLVTGGFSDWTHIYDPAVLAQHFTLLAQYDFYRIYARRR